MATRAPRYKNNRLKQLRGFCYAARTGSISKAAEELYLTQPTVSLQVQALERELDTKLFERRGPKLILTHDGEKLFDMARSLVDRIDGIADEFQAARDSVERGRLDVAAGGSTIQYVLPRFVEQFVGQYPGVDLKLHNVTGQAGLELLRAGDVDFAVGPLLEVPEDIAFHPIVSYDPLLITPQGHPLANKLRVTLEDIGKYPLILPPRNLSTWRIVEYAFADAGVNYEVKLEVGGYEVIKKYVELGLGVSIVMSICITGDEKKLAVKPVGRYFPKRTYGVVLRKSAALTPQAKAFIQIMDPNARVLWDD